LPRSKPAAKLTLQERAVRLANAEGDEGADVAEDGVPKRRLKLSAKSF
jgi:hypothetical protein